MAYRRILALIDLDRQGEVVLQRALALGRLNAAELALLHLVEPDTSSDGGYPGPSRHQVREAYEREALRRLRFLAATQGAGDVACHARCGHMQSAFKRFAADWQPDLVIADTRIARKIQGGDWDILTIQANRHRQGGRRIGLLNWLYGLASGQA